MTPQEIASAVGAGMLMKDAPVILNSKAATLGDLKAGMALQLRLSEDRRSVIDISSGKD